MIKTEKPWGYEELLEHNDFYVLKRLFMKKKHQCSLQYHEEKHETIYVLSGLLKLICGDDINSLKEIILEPNDFYVIETKKIHRMFGIEDSIYLESSTNQLNDVIRIEDDYERK